MPTLYDPVAAAYAIRAALCSVQAMHPEVDEKGFTRLVEGRPNVQVCIKSDEKSFWDFLFQQILGEPAY